MIYKSSHIGKYHEVENGENQDYICTGNSGKNTVISLADGISECCMAKKGAEVAGEVLTHLLVKKGERIMEYDHGEIADITVSHILGELQRKARQDERPVEDYSSTLAGVLYEKGRERLLLFNLGDSIIITTSCDDCKVAAIPFDSTYGCCATTTRNCALAATVKVMDADGIKSVIICSDGAWRHMFSENRLKTEVGRMLKNGEFDELRDYLDKQGCPDDYSFVAMNIDTRRPA